MNYQKLVVDYGNMDARIQKKLAPMLDRDVTLIQSFLQIKELPSIHFVEYDFPSLGMTTIADHTIYIFYRTVEKLYPHQFFLMLRQVLYHEFCHLELIEKYPMLHQYRMTVAEEKPWIYTTISLYIEFLTFEKSRFLFAISDKRKRLGTFFQSLSSISSKKEWQKHYFDFIYYLPDIINILEENQTLFVVYQKKYQHTFLWQMLLSYQETFQKIGFAISDDFKDLEPLQEVVKFWYGNFRTRMGKSNTIH